MFTSEAFAQATSGASESAGGIASVAPLILIFAVCYFLLIHPQKKKLKEHQKVMSEIKVGEKIMTVGGIIGTIVHIEDDTINLEIAKDVKIKLSKSSISDVIRPKPVNENEKK